MLQLPAFINDDNYYRKYSQPSDNQLATKALLASSAVDYIVADITLPKGYRLLRQQCEKIIKIKLLHNDSEIVFALDVHVSDKALLDDKHCAQVLVWRTVDSLHDDALINIANPLVASLLNEFVIMIADTEQNLETRRFWQRWIANAFSSKCFVYSANLGDEELKPLVNFNEYNKLLFDSSCKDKIFFVSSESLLQLFQQTSKLAN